MPEEDFTTKSLADFIDSPFWDWFERTVTAATFNEIARYAEDESLDDAAHQRERWMARGELRLLRRFFVAPQQELARMLADDEGAKAEAKTTP